MTLVFSSTKIAMCQYCFRLLFRELDGHTGSVKHGRLRAELVVRDTGIEQDLTPFFCVRGWVVLKAKGGRLGFSLKVILNKISSIATFWIH